MNTQEKKYEAGIISNSGMGGFLNPPTHPEHTKSVMFDLERKRENRGSCSLSSAIESEWLSPEIRQRAKDVLDSWQKPPIESAEIREWIHEVLGYFKACYQDSNGSWNAGELTIDANRNPLTYQDTHAGVHLIRKYYPEYIATADDFASAYWGKKHN